VLVLISSILLGVAIREAVWFWPNGGYYVEIRSDGLVAASPLHRRRLTWTQIPQLELRASFAFHSYREGVIARLSRFRRVIIRIDDFTTRLEGPRLQRAEAFHRFMMELHDQGRAGTLGAAPIVVPRGLVVTPLA
jgi:hypothetical protein